MVIELATKQDVIRIADMYSKLFSHVYKRPNSERKKEKLIDYVEVRLKRKDYFIYKAIVRNKIIGTISSKLLSSKRGFIGDAYVEPDSRRKGILKKLEKYALVKLKNRGVRIVELNVRTDNDEGLSTWNALGYKIKKRIPVKKADKLIMIKEIG
jgi:ribosomal protein S18 acetylase RimI-like enzyme